jgi:hypothetical protein
MTLQSYNLNEHFDYMTRMVPQPFGISPNIVNEILIDENENYVIKTSRGNYTLSNNAIKKLVDALGIKIRLLSYVAEETDCIALAMPIVNKLFKCFADCFVFYAKSDDTFLITDLNCSSARGEEDTIYAIGPSPWELEISKHPVEYTCFAGFNRYWDDELPNDVYVKAEDLMQGSKVVLNLFKEVKGCRLQPMLMFGSKYSNMNGFSEIYPVLYDTETGITLNFPMNYAKQELTFDEMWDKTIHLSKSTDLDDYIFREINELVSSSNTPSAVQNFITDILVNSTINVNQPIKNILNDAVTLMSQMKPAKKKKFSKQLGSLISFALCMKHEGCEHCGHLEIH